MTNVEQDGFEFTPGTNVIEYMKRQNLTWAIILKELIDNAIDAGASTIALTIATTGIQVHDDGAGCDDLRRMITLGEREDHQATRIGQYGVGLKDAAIWAAERLHIRSITAGVRHEVAVDWKAVMRLGRWWTRPIMHHSTSESAGTVIELTTLNHRKPDLQRLADELGRTYLPWLKTGHVLQMRGGAKHAFTPIEPFTLPDLLEPQTHTFVLEGKTATATIGLIPPESPPLRPGLLCLYGPRVITETRRLGIPPEALSEIFGWVEFSREWTLEKNKGEFLDDLAPLEEAIASTFAPLILRATQRRLHKPMDDVTKRLNEYLKQFRLNTGPMRKERRPGPHTQEGTVTPAHTGRRRLQATHDQPGNGFIKKRWLSTQLVPLGPQAGICQQTEDVLFINSDDPWIADVLGDAELLQSRMIFVLAAHLGSQPTQPQLVFPFAERIGASDPERICLIAKMLSGMRLSKSIGARMPVAEVA